MRFDYYMMDCFWYARDTGFRTFRTPHWPDGPGAWLDNMQGVTRQQLGRDGFIAKVWEWKKQSGGTIVEQLKRLRVQ